MQVHRYNEKLKFLQSSFPCLELKVIKEIWKKNNYNMVRTTDDLMELESPENSQSETTPKKGVLDKKTEICIVKGYATGEVNEVIVHPIEKEIPFSSSKRNETINKLFNDDTKNEILENNLIEKKNQQVISQDNNKIDDFDQSEKDKLEKSNEKLNSIDHQLVKIIENEEKIPINYKTKDNNSIELSQSVSNGISNINEKDKQIDFQTTIQENNNKIINESIRKSLDEERDIEKRIILNCKTINNEVDVSYYIPPNYLQENSWIGIFDRFEMNMKNYINSAYCNGKQSAFIRFEGLKRGKYCVRVFLDNTKTEVYNAAETCYVTVGKEISVSVAVGKEKNKRMIRVSVQGMDKPYWVGVYKSVLSSVSNNDYLLSSDITKENEIMIDISSLKIGKYECRIFCKESTEGFLFKTYHACGDNTFLVLW
ncbi:hypothetical protein EDI_251620 [Entamoeba dispar SAW760]|uniref:CUE domain-containing protein n=1 Tax=Entamoeba dispar (strain ATCC PRA-260 / SAW760) TaxID=370354 RepID=B0E6Y4_ENTDS|nr:uncharacterized protein EDI_251620 [Entamoeba dispar SAW760]EDR29725.1 hypothetical protein EDI_251620 [Entamoeba dispar SAW760]|eukprot:EDR29725.1 hypothetical protein EDI_251620 [Entamoeba dispar SAW760]